VTAAFTRQTANHLRTDASALRSRARTP
jgi:hypothetical protein